MVTEKQGINNLTPNVKLVSYSTPTENFSEEGLTDVQDLISYCARVSNPSNQFNKKTAQKLILYLIIENYSYIQEFKFLWFLQPCLKMEFCHHVD